MSYRVKRNASGTISVQVPGKRGGRNIVLKTFGPATSEAGVRDLRERALQFIAARTGQGALDLPAQEDDS